MSSLGDVLLSVLQIFQIEFTIDGLTFSFWQIFLWSIVAGIVIWVIFYWMGD